MDTVSIGIDRSLEAVDIGQTLQTMAFDQVLHGHIYTRAKLFKVSLA